MRIKALVGEQLPRNLAKHLLVRWQYQILIRLCGRLVTMQAVRRRWDNATGMALMRLAFWPGVSIWVNVLSNSR